MVARGGWRVALAKATIHPAPFPELAPPVPAPSLAGDHRRRVMILGFDNHVQVDLRTLSS